MAERYRIQIGDEIIEFEGPDNLSERQIEQLADQHLKTARPGEVFEPSVFVEEEPELVGGSVGAPTEEDTSALGSFARGVPKDATFNFADEISSFGNALGLAAIDNLTGMSGGNQQAFWDNPDGFWAAVRNNMADFKRQEQTDEEFHPVASTAGRIGGVLSTLPRAGAAAISRAPQAVQNFMTARPIISGGVLGAAGGAVSGAGAGEEGTRAQSAALGGLTGGAFGIGGSAALELAPAVANYARIFFGKGADKAAIRQIVTALERDGFDVTSPTGIKKVKDALSEFTGKPVSLADIGGSIRSRAGVGLRTPSNAQQAALDTVAQRRAGQGQRIARDIRENVAPRTDIQAIDDDLVAQRAQEATRLRDLALFENAPTPTPLPAQMIDEAPEAGLRRAIGMDDTPPSVVEPQLPVPTEGQRISRIIDPTRYDDPEMYQTAVELQNLVRLPDAQRALKAALARAESERALLASTGQPIDHLPDLNAGSNLDVRTLDYLKRYLDDEVTALYRRGQGSTFSAAEAANVRELRDAIRERLKKAVPEYGDYLDQYAGSSEMIDALREGADYTKLSPEQIVADQARRSQAGQELYRTGAARSMLDDVMSAKDNANAANRILFSPEARAQLRALGVDEAHATALERSLGQERTLDLLPQELAGSKTAQRAMAQADANAGADLHVPFNPGSPLGWAGMVGRTVLDRTSLARNRAINEELLPRLTTTDPAAIQRVIGELEAEGNLLAAEELRRRARQQGTGFVGGVVLGSPVALEGN